MMTTILIYAGKEEEGANNLALSFAIDDALAIP
jgi:hypothetical protein